MTTPKGRAKWFSLDKEDKFGNYTCNLILDAGADTERFIAKIDKLGTGKLPYVRQADGSVLLKLKLKSKGQKKDGSTYIVNPPVVYSGAGEKIDALTLAQMNIGNDSIIRAKVEVGAYSFMGQSGVSMKPKSVQLIKVVKFEGGESDLGFDAVEMDEIDDVEESSEYDF